MSTYSFADVACSLTGPGGSCQLGAGGGTAEEGITITKEDKNSQIIGADGTVANILHPNENGKITVRLLKTSNSNAILQAMYSFQRTSAANWGQNVLTLTDVASGDQYTCTGVAFKKFPENLYAKEPRPIEWEFEAAFIDPVLGTW
jgi:hypothetical protein